LAGVNFNNSIAFPRLTNDKSGMFLMQKNPVKEPVKEKISEQNLAIATHPVKKDNTNYWLGTLAVAASAIAGIYIYKGRNIENAVQSVEKQVQKINHPHIKDNFLNALGTNTEEVAAGYRHEYSLSKVINLKDGSTIEKKHGIKRVEDNASNGSVRRTLFETDDGVKLAEAFRNSMGDVIKYTVWDKEGRVIRSYDFNDDITRKFIYDKKGSLVSEVQFNREGWSLERRYEDNSPFHSEEIEFGINPQEDW